MKTSIVCSIFIIICLGCKFNLPPDKTLKVCEKPTDIIATVDAANPRKYTLALSGTLTDVSNTDWKVMIGEGLFGGTVIGFPMPTPNLSFSFTATNDATYTVSATVTTNCGDKFTLTKNIVINTQLTIESSFSLTDPMVHSELRAVAVSNDGTVMANEGLTINIWNYSSKQLIRTLSGQHAGTSVINDLVLSKDEQYLFSCTSTDNRILAWNWKTGSVMKVFSGHTAGVLSLAVSADNLYLVSTGSDRTIRVWEIATGTLIRTINASSDVFSVSISDKASFIAASFSSGFKIWSGDGTEIWSQNASSLSSSITPNGKQMLINQNDKVLIYDVASKVLQKEVPLRNVMSISISTDGKLAYCGNGVVNISSLTSLWNGVKVQIASTKIAESYRVTYDFPTSISSNGVYGCYGNFDGEVFLVQIDNGTLIERSIERHSTVILNSVLSKDGKTLFVGSINELKSFDVSSGQERVTFDTDAYYPFYMNATSSFVTNVPGFNPTGFLSNRERLTLWNLDGTQKNKFTSNPTATCCGFYGGRSSITSDEKYFIATQSSGNMTIGAWDLSNGNLVKSFLGNSIENFCTVTKDNKYVIGQGDNSIIIWDFEKGAARYINISNITDIQVSSDNSLILVEGIGQIRVLSFETGSLIRTIQTGLNLTSRSLTQIGRLTLSSDNNKVAVISKTTKKVKIYNVTTGILLKEVDTKFPPVNIFFNADNSKLYLTTEKDFQVLNVQ